MMARFFAVASIFILFFAACTKEGTIETVNGGVAKSFSGNVNTPIVYGLTYGDVIALADSHNCILSRMLSVLDFDCTNLDTEIQTRVSQFTQDTHIARLFDSVAHSVYPFTPIYEIDMVSAVYEFFQVSQPAQVASLLTAVDEDRIASSSLQDIEDVVDSIEAVAMANLTQADLLVVMAYAEVMRNSASYWLSASAGGENQWDSLFMEKNDKPTPQDSTSISNRVGEVVLADCAHAAVGCIIVAALGAINPALAAPALTHAARHVAVASAAKAAEVVKEEKEKQNQNQGGN